LNQLFLSESIDMKNDGFAEGSSRF
jgi:hypothetical protein